MERQILRFINKIVILIIAIQTNSSQALAETTSTVAKSNAVYAMTNQVSGNAVVVFKQKPDGTLSLGKTFATGGQGIGDEVDAEGLGSQGALALSDNKQWLYAVNAGSDDISIFAIQADGNLTLIGKTASGGNQPISVTIHQNLMYVLNYDRIAADCGNITGFKILSNGMLSPLAGSTRPLSTCGSNPGQVAFNRAGNLLAVTEKATHLIDTYTIDTSGLASNPIPQQAFAENPFSLAFSKRGVLLVADGFGDRVGEGAVSSYITFPNGALKFASPPIGNFGTATCWIVIDQEGKYAYVTNTNSGTVSTYKIEPNGKITLDDAQAAVIGNDTKPRDLVLTENGKYVYTLNSAVGTISGFKVQEDGKLKPIGTTGGVPFPGSGGITAR